MGRLMKEANPLLEGDIGVTKSCLGLFSASKGRYRLLFEETFGSPETLRNIFMFDAFIEVPKDHRRVNIPAGLPFCSRSPYSCTRKEF